MKQRICPICDHKMSSAHYCKSCRRWIKEPYVREVNYYLNENHPEHERNCEYHDPVIPNRPADQRKSVPKAAAAGTAGSRPRSGTRWKPQFIAVAVFIILSSISTIKRGWDNRLDSLTSSSYETEYEETASIELSDEEVEALGGACNGYYHFNLTKDEILPELLLAMGASGLQLSDNTADSTNTQEEYEGGTVTYYNHTDHYAVLGGESPGTDIPWQWMELGSDTATGQLHYYSVSLFDQKQSVEAAITFIRLAQQIYGTELGDEEQIRKQLNDELESSGESYYENELFYISSYRNKYTTSIGVYSNLEELTEEQ